MKVTAYIHARRLITPTGVGKHIMFMPPCLARAPGVDLSLLTSRHDLDNNPALAADPQLSALPLHVMNPKRRTAEFLWQYVGVPKVERWSGPCDWVYCPMEAFAATNARLAVTIHATYFFEHGEGLPIFSLRTRWRMSSLFRTILRRADLVLTVSDFMRQRLVQLFHADPSKIAVVGNGCELEYYAPAKPASPPEIKRPYFLVVGGLRQIKGAEHILAAARVLQQVAPDAQIRIIGQSLPPYDAQAHQLDNIVELGYLPAPQIVQQMRFATAMWFFSRYESFGIPAVEAMAAGTPVITSGCGALAEIVGDAGIILDTANSAEVVARSLDLLKNSATRETLIAKGKTRALDYTWEACAARLHAALQRGHAG